MNKLLIMQTFIKSLARAVYSKREVLLLDDPFRGLDAHTEDQIFHNLLGQQGLLRKSGITVVFVTSTGRFEQQ